MIKLDLKGIENLSQDGNLYIAGAPTPEGLDVMKSRGVSAVIDVRTEGEISPDYAETVRQKGMTYVNLPMGSDGLTDDLVKRFLAEMKKRQDETILLHCAGANRAGALYGLYIGKQGQCSADEAIALAKRAGMRSEKYESDLRRRLGGK